jgi:hypothetical protein
VPFTRVTREGEDVPSAASRSRLVLERSRLDVERPPETFETFYRKEFAACTSFRYPGAVEP